jgi:hypothetical protein
LGEVKVLSTSANSGDSLQVSRANVLSPKMAVAALAQVGVHPLAKTAVELLRRLDKISNSEWRYNAAQLVLADTQFDAVPTSGGRYLVFGQLEAWSCVQVLPASQLTQIQIRVWASKNEEDVQSAIEAQLVTRLMMLPADEATGPHLTGLLRLLPVEIIEIVTNIKRLSIRNLCVYLNRTWRKTTDEPLRNLRPYTKRHFNREGLLAARLALKAKSHDAREQSVDL